MLGALFVVGGPLSYGAYWYEGAISGSPGGSPVIVDVTTGQSVESIAGEMERQKVISSTLAFRVYLVFHGTPLVRPGGYLLHEHQAYGQVADKLNGGPDVFPVTIPAGFTVSEIAARVGQLPGHHKGEFLTTATSGSVMSPFAPLGSRNLDGLLGAKTYIVLPGETDTTLVAQMVDAFDTEAQIVSLSKGASSLGITPYQAVIVASVLQKEAVYQKNMANVARVVYNRLARGMPLQMDSTVLYAEDRDGGPVTSSDLAVNSPYNTYLHKGLPPTPICVPSQEALAAALSPATGQWLYFVLVAPDGTEAFSDTFAEQLANEKLAQSRGLIARPQTGP